MKIAIALLLLAGSVAASPVDYMASITFKATPFVEGFSRAEGRLPLGARILSASREGESAVIYFTFDPEAEWVWRRVVMLRGVQPMVLEIEKFIGEKGGTLFWDEGEFMQPLGKVAAH